MTVANIGSRKAAFKKYLVWGIVIISVIWTIRNWSSLDDIKNELSKSPIFLVALLVTEVLFVYGIYLVAKGSGKMIFAGTGRSPIKWIRALRDLRKTWKQMLAEAPTNRLVRRGYYMNYVAAIATMLVIIVGILMFLPEESRGILVVPIVDIFATIGARILFQKKFSAKGGYYVRLAQLDDMEEIAALDTSRYEDITPVYSDDPVTMFRRRYNNAPEWFWVMVDSSDAIVGLLSVARTNRHPEDFRSWEDSTANGTLDGKVDPKGKRVYVTALTTTQAVGDADEDSRLIAYGMAECLRHGVGVANFSGRMPGYHLYSDHMTPEEYYDAKDPNNPRKALDKQIRRYESWGMRRLRLVKDGFVADWKSHGYGVLFQFDLPVASWSWPIIVRRPASWLVGTILRYGVNREWLWPRIKKVF